MNSYNENLHASVVSSLNTQQLELQKLKAELGASTFSMYYAQGARITAAEKLELVVEKYKFQQQVNEQVIVDSDLSTNVLASATNIKKIVAKSVSNTAVAAANVQIAANAILKLASDTGSIFSIVNAADFDTEIYTQSENAYELMNKTAYLAERTSQHSMEASALISEVSANTLSDKATVDDTAIKGTLGIVTKELNKTTAQLETEMTNLAAANNAEKKAEGALEDAKVAYDSSKTAYQLSNQELNLKLRVKTPTVIGDSTYYTVSFNEYENPFEKFKLNATRANTDNPVKNYYIMLVKQSKGGIFSISEAEGLVTEDDKERYKRVSPNDFKPVIDPDGKIDENDPKATSQQIFTSELLDTDGDKMMLGSVYVVFVYAELKTDYKKTINTFDNYLSAASANFNLTNQLNAPEPATITVTSDTEIVDTLTDNLTTHEIIFTEEKITTPQQLTFNVWEMSHYNVQYRCMFLPHNPNLITGLLTVEGLQSIEGEAEGLEAIADKYDPQIAHANLEITSFHAEINGVDKQIEEVKVRLTESNPAPSKTEEKKLNSQLTKLETSKESLKKQLTKIENELTKLKSGKTSELQELEHGKKHIKPGFYFDLLTATQVPAGSYKVAKDSDKQLLRKLSQNIIDIIEDVEELEADMENLEAGVQLFSDDIKKLLKKIENNNDAEKVKLEIIGFLEGVRKAINDAKGVKKEVAKIISDLTNLLNDIIDLVNNLVSALEAKELLADIDVLINGHKLLSKGYVCSKKQITIAPEVTDNFGNRLINKNNYIPTVLAITDAASESEKAQFSNVLSKFQKTDTFKYHAVTSTGVHQL